MVKAGTEVGAEFTFVVDLQRGLLRWQRSVNHIAAAIIAFRKVKLTVNIIYG